MTTENQRQALDLAKRIFEHFTRDALPLAREILAMERQLESNESDEPKSLTDLLSPQEPTTTIGARSGNPFEDLPSNYNPGSYNHPRAEKIATSTETDFPF